MNAYELAKELEDWYSTDAPRQAATMLRHLHQALEQISTGEIVGEPDNYKDALYIVRKIATEALASDSINEKEKQK